MPVFNKSDILFIINSNAGKMNVKNILLSFKIYGNDLRYVITSNLDSLNKLMDDEFDNYKVFVAVGGDGTVNSLAKFLIGKKDKVLGVLPLGSGNGFAKELGFRTNLWKLVREIKRGETIDIDVLELNGNSFVNVAGIGLDAEIAHDFQHKLKRGFISYIFSSINSYFSYKTIEASIKSHSVDVEGTYQMISFCNTRQFGNNALISPKSTPYDGKFEIVTVKKIPFILALPFVFKLFQGLLRNSHYLRYYSCEDSISVNTNCKKYHIDGDPLICDGNYNISINKNCLRVIKTGFIKK
jgi:diacylglycerol kinase (ATP)